MDQLIVENLTLRLGGRTILDKVSLSAGKGEFLVLLGPSGCGKSSLLRSLAGLNPAHGGRIFLAGQEVGDLPPQKRDVAMVFQSYALYPHLTVRQNLAFPLKVRGQGKQARERAVGEAAGLLGIGDLLDRKPASLSGGQRQRVAIGRAIVRRPKLFLFDEPLSNLDARLRAEMRVELAKLHARLATTTVYVTHDQVEALTLGDRVAVMERGRLRQVGPPGEIYDRPADTFVAGFVGSPAMNFLAGSVERGKGGLFLRDAGLAAPLPLPANPALPPGGRVRAGIRPEDLAVDEKGPFAGEIEVVERVGPGLLVHFSLAGARFTAATGLDFGGRAGQRAAFSAPPGKLHLFSPEGQRL